MGRARPTGTNAIELRLLGPVEASVDGDAVALGGPKPRALLAVLALDLGHVVSVDRIVEALWPGDTPGTAPHAVQVYVSQLRKALGPVIATRAPGYALELDRDRVDVHRFERIAQEGRTALALGRPEAAEPALREALALWRGPALADFLYEPFAQSEIARLEELRATVLEERVEADLALGRHAELVSELEALVQAQPLRERPRAQLMLALYRSGRQADALAAYRAARETLVDELGIEPGHDLKELEAGILRQDASLLLDTGEPAKLAMQFRRLATILFCDVVDSMAVAGALDPEALASVQGRYFETVSAAVLRHGGMVEKYAGDAVMAAFGVPVSHEDDALRAARAAFEIREGVAALGEQLVREHELGLEVRIGIAAGEVVASSTSTRERFVAGDAVGVAARLEHAARPGEIVVGEVVARLIDHAARLEPLGELEVRSRREPIAMFRLAELEPVARAFERRLDAKLVGRTRELAALRKSLKRATTEGSPHAALVVSLPGVGKSRLALELVRRARGVTWLWGRCLSYGEGITYWPLREALAGAEATEERDAVVAALEAEKPPPAPEIAWLFRRFCERAADERPLVLVLDDVHWAEPTLLELVELLLDRAEAPVLVVCLARDELLERHPAFLEGREHVNRIALDVLSAEETEALLEGLGGATLESDHRTRIVDAAEGNPLFLEQLFALALEGGLATRPLPETIQALLAARLDRLGPGERAVLERAAVIGKEFRLDDVVVLLEPDAAPTVEAHIGTLTDRGFVREAGDGELAFRHVLVQEAVYRAAPKRLRAELHERYANRLDETHADLPDLDELAGYHLERAHRLWTELGEPDRRTGGLAVDAGHRLAAAGMRAFERGDMHAAVSLLGRATGLLPAGAEQRRDLLCDYALALDALQESERAVEVLTGLLDESREPWDARTGARARMELELIRFRNESGASGDALLEAVEQGIPIFEPLGDHRSVGRAWLLAGWTRGGHRGDHAAWAAAAERALESYRATGWPVTTCLGELAAALYWGPAPVPRAIERVRALGTEFGSNRAGVAYLEAFLGGLVAQGGDVEEGRRLLLSARAALEDLGLRAAALRYAAAVLGEIELLAGEPAAAEAVLRPLCAELEHTLDIAELASRASDLAEALLAQGLDAEAEQWTHVAERHAASDDVIAQMTWRPPRARVLARRGEHQAAEQLARAAMRLAEATDWLNGQAHLEASLGDVLRLAGRADEAAAAYARAAALYERKGNVLGAASVQAVLDDEALVREAAGPA
jgi:DNA-binding SARP family transcriptional activator